MAAPFSRRTLVLGALLAARAAAAVPSPPLVPLQGRDARRPRAARPAWRLPERGFVEYRKRRLRFRFKGDRRILYEGQDPAPGFYARELDARGRVSFANAAVPDLLPMLALSLAGRLVKAGEARRWKTTFSRIQKVGSVTATGEIETTAVEPALVRQRGAFRLETVRSVFPKAKRLHRPRSDWQGRLDLAAELTFERRVDTKRGLVERFHGRLTGEVTTRTPKPKSYPFELEEEWTFEGVRAPGYRGFRTRVNEAIRKGEAFLAKKLATWRGMHLFDDRTKVPSASVRTYGTGRLALILLALCKQNPNRDKAPIPKLLAELRKREPYDSYALALALMALDAYYEPPNEAEQLRQGLIDAPSARHPSPSDRRLMERWAKRLLENRDTRVDDAYRLRFNYRPGPRYDNSVTQYAALGLFSAELCGVALPRGTWRALLEHFLRDQGPREGKQPIRLRLRRHGEGGRRRGRTQAAVAAYPRGFSYNSAYDLPTGSMTAAGLTGLALCRMALARAGRLGAKTARTIQDAVRAAFAWLATEYELRGNPRRGRAWHFYYLYGLERACELNSVAEIQGRDWYFDGAMQLLGTQQRDGGWENSLESTCFALLFLKRSVAAPLTKKD